MVIICSVNPYLFNTEKVNSKYDNQIALNLHNNNATILYSFFFYIVLSDRDLKFRS